MRVLFEQPQFTTSALSGIAAETGVEIVILDGLAEDYIENMKEMAAKIAPPATAANGGKGPVMSPVGKRSYARFRAGHLHHRSLGIL